MKQIAFEDVSELKQVAEDIFTHIISSPKVSKLYIEKSVFQAFLQGRIYELKDQVKNQKTAVEAA